MLFSESLYGNNTAFWPCDSNNQIDCYDVASRFISRNSGIDNGDSRASLEKSSPPPVRASATSLHRELMEKRCDTSRRSGVRSGERWNRKKREKRKKKKKGRKETHRERKRTNGPRNGSREPALDYLKKKRANRGTKKRAIASLVRLAPASLLTDREHPLLFARSFYPRHNGK